MKFSNQERRLRQWAVGKADLSGTRKLVLQAILLRMSAFGDPCTASYHTLARDTGLGVATIYKHVAGREVVIGRENGRRSPSLTVRPRPSEEEERALRRLWQAQRPPDPMHDAWWSAQLARLSPPQEHRLRFIWERGLRKSDLTPTVRGIGWATSLLWSGRGELLRVPTLDELAGLAGRCRKATQEGLDALKKEGWVRLHAVPGKGVLPLLRLPESVLYHAREGSLKW